MVLSLFYILLLGVLVFVKSILFKKFLLIKKLKPREVYNKVVREVYIFVKNVAFFSCPLFHLVSFMENLIFSFRYTTNRFEFFFGPNI